MTMRKRVGRLEGRLFADDGCLFMVLGVDEEQGLATVSCRVAGTRQVVEMPIDQVYQRISSERALILDNLNGSETLRRVHEGEDGWYFVSREGAQGPFVSKDVAANQLCRYILTMQTRTMEAPAVTRPSPNRGAPRRRAEDQPSLRAAV
jgi:hypothetical protein